MFRDGTIVAAIGRANLEPRLRAIGVGYDPVGGLWPCGEAPPLGAEAWAMK